MSAVNIEKRHILVISGDPLVLAEVKMELIRYFDISIASTISASITSLEQYKTAAVIIHIGENREYAFSVFNSILDFVRSKNVPVIFLAEKGTDEDENAAFSLGAADYNMRRRGTIDALVSRINLRIRAGENEIRLLGNEISPPPSESAPEEILNGKTILIAEDIELNREIMACMLSDIKGLTLEFAFDGKELVEKFANAPDRYSLIFTDVNMPEMNGLEATKAIRELDCENAREIPIIALTGSCEESDISICLEAGMNDFTKKPISYDDLISAAAGYCL